MTPRPRARFRLGCFGALVFAVGVMLALYALLAPWSFHIGGRWTPASWWGVGRLRDSTGAQYGLYIYFYPRFRGASRLGNDPFPRTGLRGQGLVCTQGGAQYRFDLSGQISGAWLNADGKRMSLYLSERRGPKLRRQFNLYGYWQGPDLVLDDHQSMIRFFRPDGTLTPSLGYTSPLPDKHATVTLSWGGKGEFESLCTSIARGGSRTR